jgi:hypothetical protein
MKTSIRFATAGVAALALGGAFLLGTTVDSPLPDRADNDDIPRPAATAGEPLSAGDLSLVAAGDCDTLLEWYVDNTRDQVTAWGWGGGRFGYAMDDGIRRDAMALSDVAGAAPFAADSRAANKSLSQSSSETGTNVQEVGVDETDVVKTNGEVLVRLVEDDLVVHDVSGAAPERVSRFDLPGNVEGQPELLLVGDRAVVFSQRWTQDGPTTRVDTVSLADPASPDLVSTSAYDASLLSARQYDETVRLVLGTGLPMLDFVTPQGELTEREALKRNRAVLAESSIEDWLPTVADGDDEAQQLVDCADMARPEDFAGAGTVSVIGWSADEPADRSSTGVATGSQVVYSSTDRLYLATSAWTGCCIAFDGPLVDRIMPPWPGGGDDGTTQLHAFALEGRDASYLGSGEVEGSVRDRWAMDAVDGTLRVAVGPTGQTGDWNSVVTLEEKDGALQPLGRVDRLGVNEQIMSVRWFDDLAVLVTFRQVDPLYAIDLSDPSRPKKLGALKIPGFSDYLHPIGGDRILGLGVDADLDGMTRGGQAAVFDLADPRSPKRLDVETYARNIEVRAGQEPRQFTWVADQQTAYTVIARHGRNGGTTGWVSMLKIGKDGTIERRNVKGTTGYDDVAALRTVPLSDGRVVVVTEDDARFL